MSASSSCGVCLEISKSRRHGSSVRVKWTFVSANSLVWAKYTGRWTRTVFCNRYLLERNAWYMLFLCKQLLNLFPKLSRRRHIIAGNNWRTRRFWREKAVQPFNLARTSPIFTKQLSLHNIALWLQIQHVLECERILSNLLEKTPETHRDYTELGKVVSKFKQVCARVIIIIFFYFL